MSCFFWLRECGIKSDYERRIHLSLWLILDIFKDAFIWSARLNAQGLNMKNKLTILIGEIALKLHKNRTEELSCDLPVDCQQPIKGNSLDFTIEDNAVHFSSTEARNRCIASYLFEKNRKSFKADSHLWLKAAYDLWRHEIGKEDRASGRLLALVHAKDDILSIASSAIENGYMEVFDVLHVVEAALPYLNKLEPDGIYRLCDAQYERTKNDLAAGHFFSHLEKLLSGHPETCREIHTHLRSNVTETIANLHPVSLLALAKSSPEESLFLAHADADSSNIILKRVSIWTLGRLLLSSYISESAIPSVSSTIITNLYDPDDQIRRTAIHAAAQAITVMDVFDLALFKLGESGDQDALATIAHFLMINTQEMKGKANFEEWIRLLCKLSPHVKGGIDNFDLILSQLIAEESSQQLAISCLTEWLKVNAIDTPRDKSVAKLFNSTVFELAKQQLLLSQVITDWLLSDLRKLASAAAGILSTLRSHDVRNIEFYLPRIDILEKGDLIYLVRGMLGFVYSEDHLIALTMSLLKTNNPQQRVFGLVYSILVDELGQDYPDSTIKALENAKTSTTDEEWVDYYCRAIDTINSRMDAIEALPRLIELRPSSSLQRQFAQAHAKQMNTLVEESQKESIFSQIMTKISIKAGRGTFSFRNGNFTDSSQLQSFSHAVTLPRRNTLDTVGYELSHLGFRLAKRVKQ